MESNKLNKYIVPKYIKDDLHRTSIKITKEQAKFIESNRLNLSLMIRDYLETIMNNKKVG